ncbi:MAG: response regulator [Myxococcales bacterium]|nr:response regulator [Myxococcales bacterium]MCB9539087.1 response regulator [Myxococcales bacterium]
MTDAADRKTILLADDDAEMRRMVRRALASFDADIIEAKDGEETIERIVEHHPDLVVLDVWMPEFKGWEVCKYIRSKADYDDIAVLMLTGIGKSINEMTAPLYGADDHLDKPFDVAVLQAKVKRLLQGRPDPAEAAASEDDDDEG